LITIFIIGEEHSNVKMDLEKRFWDGMGWIYAADDRDQWWSVVDLVINFHVL